MSSPPTTPPPVAAHRTFGQRLLLLAGSLGPLGYAPASGTVAVAIAGIPLCWWMKSTLDNRAYLAVTVLFTLAAMLLHHAGDRLLGESDSRKLVWDELAGFFIAMYLVPMTWPLVVAGFLLERLIDIVKVPPARWVDRNIHSGLGVVLDDVIAGVYTCALLHLLRYVFPQWG